MVRLKDQPADTDFFDYYQRLVQRLDLGDDHDTYSRSDDAGGRSGVAILPDGILSFQWTARTEGNATLIPWEDVEGVRITMDFQGRGVQYRLTLTNPETKLTDDGDALWDVIRGVLAARPGDARRSPIALRLVVTR